MKRNCWHKVVDFDAKVQTLEKELGAYELSQGENSMSDINNYIEILESILSNGARKTQLNLKS